jgi:phosphatidylserine decarboxylase
MPPVATPRDVPVEPPAGDLTPADRSHEQAALFDTRVAATSPAHVAALVRAAVPPMHPGGRPVVAGVAALAGLTRLVTGRGALVGALATAATAAFFRNPRRVPPSRTGVVLAAADGTVAHVREVVPPPELDLPRVPAPRVSVFLSVLDVHVQRIPADGRVLDVQYRPGRFLSADLDKASDDNERNALLLETVDGARVGVVQIAGLLARRIRCDVTPGAEVAAGETFGLIRFGSRVDTYLPAGSVVAVAVGQRTIGGETILAELPIIAELPSPAGAGAAAPGSA